MSPPCATILDMKEECGRAALYPLQTGIVETREAPAGGEAHQVRVYGEPAPRGFPKLRIGGGYAYTCAVFMPLHTVRCFC